MVVPAVHGRPRPRRDKHDHEKDCHRIRHYEKTKERVKKRLKSVPQVLTCTRCPLLAVILVMFSPFPRRFVFCLAGGYGLFALSISGS